MNDNLTLTDMILPLIAILWLIIILTQSKPSDTQPCELTAISFGAEICVGEYQSSR